MPATHSRRRTRSTSQMQAGPLKSKLRKAAPEPKKIIQSHPGVMERAGLQLAGYEQRASNLSRRAFFPKSETEVNQRREQIRGMSPKQLREYLGKFNPNEQIIQQVQQRKGTNVTVNTRINQTIRVQKKKGSPVKSVSLTNYGKFSKIFTDPAGRAWENMDANHRERMAEYIVKTTDKFLSSTKHAIGDEPARRLRADEVRGRRLPTIENMANQLHKQIESDAFVLYKMKKEGKNPVMIQQMERMTTGLKNRATIIEGIIRGIKNGQFDNATKRAERKHVKRIRPTREEKKPEIKTPQETRPVPSQITDAMRERWRNSKPLTPDDVTKATQQLNSRLFLIQKEYSDKRLRATAIERALHIAERTAIRVLEQKRAEAELPLTRRRRTESELVYLPEYVPSNTIELSRYEIAKKRESSSAQNSESASPASREAINEPTGRLRKAILRGWQLLRRAIKKQ